MEIEFEVRGGVAFLTLNRPEALNALNLAMIGALREALCAIESDDSVHALVMRGAGARAFCAGGDIRALYDSNRAGSRLHRDFFVDEYRLDFSLHRFAKPYVALADGITMGGGMGLAQAAWRRVVGDRTRIAMPEVGIGLIPDVGGSYFLSRLPGALGAYLALTGRELRAADAIEAGLADLYLSPAALERLEAALTQLRWQDDPRRELEQALRALASPPPPGTLAPLREAIDRHFAGGDVAAILASLQAERDPRYAAWAAETASLMQTRSPTMLQVSLRALAAGRQGTLADAFRMEYTVVQHCFVQGDLAEGVRALIIDKDKKPQWRPARLEEVEPASVEAFFRAPPGPHPLADLGAR
ncbi:MAG: enoyl-CoA hydratase/isomerase family protein [Gammaproteobacteria bacterium]|nr:enoyl-CoA hydratase/isomerase family protein [Gammaproteobacteria bacterium]